MTLAQEDPSGCWLLTRNLNSGGYGRIRIGGRGGRFFMAHRISYEVFVGPIPEGLTIDHLCRVRNCINPSHLEPVSLGENVLRGTAPAAINARLTHCKKAGHPLVEGNLTHDTPGHRRCKKCRAEYEAERNQMLRRRRQERAA